MTTSQANLSWTKDISQMLICHRLLKTTNPANTLTNADTSPKPNMFLTFEYDHSARNG